MNKLAIVFIIKTMIDICYFFILARDYLGMFMLTLILIISIINTILLLYLIIKKNSNISANKICNQNENKGIILNIQKITTDPYKDNANKSAPSNYNEFNN